MKKRKRSLKTCAVVLILLSAILLVSGTLIANSLFYMNAFELAKKSMEISADGLCRDINDWIDNVIESLQYVAYSDEMADYMTKDGYLRYESKNNLVELMKLLLWSNREVEHLRISMKSEQSFSVSMESNITLQQYLTYMNELRKGSILQSIQTGRVILSDVFEYIDDTNPELSEHIIYVIVPMQRRIYKECYGALTAACNLDRFLDSFSPDGLKYAVYYSGDMLINTSPEIFENYNYEEKVRCEDGYYQIVNSNPCGDWQVLVASKSMIVRHETLWMSIIFLAMVLLSHIALLLSVNRMLVRPIQSLSNQAVQVQNENEKFNYADESGNEIEYLTFSLNDMMMRLQKAKNERIETQRILHEAQMRHMSERIIMLQTQVNPHFLYNTLECIRGMAAVGDMEAVREMVSTMARIYRYCLKHDVRATLDEELDCAKAFFRIIELRYADRYHLAIDVPEVFMKQMIPCMTLQPILENAIYHGFAGRAHGQIWIYAENNHLIIKNDGHSMPEEVIYETNMCLFEAKLDKNEEIYNENIRIGLQNVNMRLKLLTGNDSPLFLQSVSGGGVAVHICLEVG